jgi:hypothetical protein
MPAYFQKVVCKLLRKHAFTAKLHSKQCGEKRPY